MRKRFLYFFLCRRKLVLQVPQLLLRFSKLPGNPRQNILDACDIACRVFSHFERVAALTFQSQLVALGKTIKRSTHGKPGIFSNLAARVHGFQTGTGCDQRSSRFFSVREFLAPDGHGEGLRFFVLILFLLFLEDLDCFQISLQSSDTFFYCRDLYRVSAGNIRFQTVVFICVVGF